MFDSLRKNMRDLSRIRHILDVFIEQGFGFFVEKVSVMHFLTLKHPRKTTLPPEVRLRKTLEKLGPTFVKLGQILSLRPDLIPKAYAKELGKLQDSVKPFPFEEARRTVEEELSRPLDKVFSSFSRKPIASASISQVHKARLKDGTLVAVKVQRPGVKDLMQQDIEIMGFLAKKLEKHSERIRKYKPTGLIEEFRQWTAKELDFLNEANNARRFYSNFKGARTVKVPKVYGDYSGKRMVVFEYIDGVELHRLDLIKGKKGYDMDEIMKNGFDMILTQVFIHGFFHADPHPSNILVMKNNVLALVDFGIVGYFDDSLREKSIRLFYGIVEQDVDSIIETFLEMGMFDKQLDQQSLREDIKQAIEPMKRGSIKDARISLVLEKVLSIALKHHVRIPRNFVLFGKTIVELEGIAIEYAPDLKFIEKAEPFIEKLIKNRTNISGMRKEIKRTLLNLVGFFQEIPGETKKALKKIQEGKFSIDMHDSDIKKLSVEIDRSSNRIAYSVVIAALIIGGALTVSIEPKILNMSWISFLAFLTAVVLGFVLLISIIRENI